jgi:hypothetical protein
MLKHKRLDDKAENQLQGSCEPTPKVREPWFAHNVESQLVNGTVCSGYAVCTEIAERAWQSCRERGHLTVWGSCLERVITLGGRQQYPRNNDSCGLPRTEFEV